MRSTIAMLRGAKVLSSGSATKRLWPATQFRFLAEDAGADAAPKLGWTEELRQKWKKVAVALDPPKTLSEFMKQRPPVPAVIPPKLTLNLVLPHQVEMEAEEVDMVIIPASSGQMGVLPGHVPTIAELRPGVLSIHDGGAVKTQYFVSGGFALIHANSVTDIVAVEAAPLDRFDPEEVKSGLAEFTQKLNTATTDLDKAQAQIGVEVHGALSAALGL